MNRPEGNPVKPGRGGGGAPANDVAADMALDDVDGDLNVFLGFRAQNDLGNAERLLHRFGADLAYVTEWGWLAWDGQRWSLDEGPRRTQLLAQQTVKLIRGESKAANSAPLANWARESGSRSRISALQHEARPHLTQKMDVFDAQPWLLNVGNGTLVLGNGGPPGKGPCDGITVMLRDHEREDFLTHVCTVDYNPRARSDDWQLFLDTILPDRDVQDFAQRYFGYALTGVTSEKAMFIGLGESGNNGKSALFNAVGGVLGDYECALPVASLLRNDRPGGSGPSPDIARLPGMRLVRTSEPESGSQFSETKIKTLTGGEPMPTRHLNMPFFEFVPTFKLVMGANLRPAVQGVDDAIWERLKVVPFEQKVGREVVGLVLDSDNKPREHLRAAILNWALDGFRVWFERGLLVPEKVRLATDAYRSDSDPIGVFISQWVVMQKGENVGATRLYNAYKIWCHDAAVDPLSQTKFGRRLTDRGLRKEKIGISIYCDMRLSEEAVQALSQAPDDGQVGGDYAATD